MSINKDQLIKDLKNDLVPVSPLLPIWKNALYWLVTALVIFPIDILVLGLRRDLSDALMSTNFLIQQFLLLATMLVSGFSCLLLIRPGRSFRWPVRLSWLGLSLWSVVVLLTLAQQILNFSDLQDHHLGFSCSGEVFGLSAATCMLFLLLTKQGASTHKRLTAMSLLIACASFATFTMQFTCSDSTGTHTFVWHFIPTIAIIILGAITIVKKLKGIGDS